MAIHSWFLIQKWEHRTEHPIILIKIVFSYIKRFIQYIYFSFNNPFFHYEINRRSAWDIRVDNRHCSIAMGSQIALMQSFRDRSRMIQERVSPIPDAGTVDCQALNKYLRDNKGSFRRKQMPFLRMSFPYPSVAFRCAGVQDERIGLIPRTGFSFRPVWFW